MAKTMERALPVFFVLLAAWAFWTIFGPAFAQQATRAIAAQQAAANVQAAAATCH